MNAVLYLSRTSSDNRSLVEQEFCSGLPWEKVGLTPGSPRTGEDERAGEEIGSYRVVRQVGRQSLLAVREESGGPLPAMLRRIELPGVVAGEVEAHAQWASRFHHPNLSRVYGCEVTEEAIYWVTEPFSGASLAEISEACRATGKAVPMGLALAAVYDAALALSAVHAVQSSAHGLISDRAVMVTFEGGTKLLDLGLARCVARRPCWAEVSGAVGPYLAPEQSAGESLSDPQCDVYSLAMVLYEALAGQRLRRSTTLDGRTTQPPAPLIPLSQLNLAVTRQLDEVMTRALAIERPRRFASAEPFAQALREAAGSFAWRTAMRRQFTSSLFPTRVEREQELLAQCENPPPRRRRVLPPQDVLVPQAPFVMAEVTAEVPVPQMTPVDTPAVDFPATDPSATPTVLELKVPELKVPERRVLTRPSPDSPRPTHKEMLRPRASTAPVRVGRAVGWVAASGLLGLLLGGAASMVVGRWASPSLLNPPEPQNAIAVAPAAPEDTDLCREGPTPPVVLASFEPTACLPLPRGVGIDPSSAAVAPSDGQGTPEPAHAVGKNKRKSKSTKRRGENVPLPPWLKPRKK